MAVFRKEESGIQKRRERYSEKSRVVFRIGESETAIVNWWSLRSVEAIPGEFQHMLVVANMDKKQ